MLRSPSTHDLVGCVELRHRSLTVLNCVRFPSCNQNECGGEEDVKGRHGGSLGHAAERPGTRCR